MSRDSTSAGEADDPFKLAARIAEVSGGSDIGVLAEVLVSVDQSADLHRSLPDPGDMTGEPADDLPGGVVLANVGGLNVGYGKEARKAFESIVGKKLPYAAPVDVAKAHRVLVNEFPHLAVAIRVLMSDLQSAAAGVRFRPTLLVGPAGGGKSRLVRRLGELCNLPVARFDAAAASDSSFGGTARRWSSGEPSFPLNAILAHRTPNVLILLDELDKSGTSIHNGSLTNSLLPMTEIETSRRFPDPYSQSECDLSYLSFVATCNDERALPAMLRDRFRLLRIPAPTLDHLPSLARGIVADIAAEMGGDPRFFEPLNDGELAVAEGLWVDGSVRRLRAVIERLLARRESHPRN